MFARGQHCKHNDEVMSERNEAQVQHGGGLVTRAVTTTVPLWLGLGPAGLAAPPLGAIALAAHGARRLIRGKGLPKRAGKRKQRGGFLIAAVPAAVGALAAKASPFIAKVAISYAFTKALQAFQLAMQYLVNLPDEKHPIEKLKAYLRYFFSKEQLTSAPLQLMIAGYVAQTMMMKQSEAMAQVQNAAVEGDDGWTEMRNMKGMPRDYPEPVKDASAVTQKSTPQLQPQRKAPPLPHVAVKRTPPKPYARVAPWDVNAIPKLKASYPWEEEL